MTEDEAIRKVIDCQQGEAKRSYCGFITIVINIIIIVLLLVLFGRVDVFILVFVLCVIAFHKVYVALWWRLCIFSKFCKGCTDVSHVAGEGVNNETQLLARGLSFCPSPRHIDWTEVNADFDEFARRLHITEFFHDFTTDHQSDPFHPKSLWTPSIAEATRLMITSIQRC